MPDASDDVRGSYAFPPGEDADVYLLTARSSPAERMAPEMEHMQTALRRDGALSSPAVKLAKKYARLQLYCGTTAGSALAAGDIKRRNSLLHTNSEDLVRRTSGSVERVPMTMYGLSLHFAVVYIDQP